MKGPLQPHPGQRMDCIITTMEGVSTAVFALILGYKVKLRNFQPEAGHSLLPFSFLPIALPVLSEEQRSYSLVCPFFFLLLLHHPARSANGVLENNLV